jgi:hypothetical protein
LARSICSLDGKLSSERILEFLQVANVSPGSSFLGERLAGKVEAEFRMMKRRIKRWADASRDYQGFTRHRFPELTVEAVQDRMDRFTSVLGRTGRVRVKEHEADIFEVFG